MSSAGFAEPTAVAALMSGFEYPWAFCGGWAIDLFVGRVTRTHKDVDVAVLRRDQHAVRSYLAARGWTLETAHEGTLTPWREGESIELPVHGVWCKNPRSTPDFLELLLNEADETHFRFRRDRSLTMPLDRAFLRSKSGLPVLAPEIALLYKANNLGVPENAADFPSVLPPLDGTRRAWLKAALTKLYPGHEWLGAL